MTINREHLAGLNYARDIIEENWPAEALLEIVNNCIAQAQAAPEAEPVAWVPSAALAKLRNGSNNAPCVLTDSPAEFNDTAVYLDLAPQHDAELVELLRAVRDCGNYAAIPDEVTDRIDAKLAALSAKP